MGIRLLRTLALLLMVASLGVLACDTSTLISMVNGGGGSRPTVRIQSPAPGAEFRDGEEIAIQSTAQDPSGIVRVELSVDGAVVRTDAPPVPQGQVSFTLIQKWKASLGNHTLTVRAFNAAGTASDPALVSIVVSGGSSTPAASATAAATATLVLGLGQPTASSANVTLTPMGVFSTTSVPTTRTVSSSAAGATATRRPPTAVPPTPTIAAPPGVYALSIRVDPPQPSRGLAPTFYVRFVNSTNSVAFYRWFLKIFSPDQPNAKGETSKAVSEIPVGTFEMAAPADWLIGKYGGCEQFSARVYSYDPGIKQATEIPKPNSSEGPVLTFQVCP